MELDTMNAAVAGTRFAGRLRHFPSVGSTNSLALEAAQAGAREGVWVADEQTAGRGRGGHGWHSAAGEGLYVSALVLPRIPPARVLWISMAAGLAARKAIAECAELNVDIRWPNDLLLNEKKCGGVLVESALQAGQGEAAADRVRYAVIGIGINVNHESFPPELVKIATSLRMEAGREIAREALLASLLRALDHELELLDAEPTATAGRGELLRRFAAASTWVAGKRVRVGEGDGYTGLTAGLSADGFLLVRADDGTERTVISGGVRELK